MKSAEVRKGKILEILSTVPCIRLTELCLQVGASAGAIRRDLADLNKAHLFHTDKGKVFLNPRLPLARSIATGYTGRKRIAREAAALVGKGDRLFLSAGPTCVLLALELTAQNKELSLFTNSLYMTYLIGDNPENRISLIGGDYIDATASLVPSRSVPLPPLPQVDYCFADVGAFQVGKGFTSLNPAEDFFLQEFSKRSKETVALVNQSSLTISSPSIALTPDMATLAITDRKPSDFVQADFREYLIRLILV